jgi:hypothetical protein
MRPKLPGYGSYGSSKEKLSVCEFCFRVGQGFVVGNLQGSRLRGTIQTETWFGKRNALRLFLVDCKLSDLD